MKSITRLARVTAILCTSLVFLGAFFGRKMQRQYANLEVLIPYAGVLLLLLGAYGGVRAAKTLSLRQLVELIVCALLFIFACEVLTSTPIERMHFIKYGLLGFSLYWSIGGPPGTSMFVASKIAALVGLSEGGLQYFIPERFFDLRDIAINLGAAGLGIAFARSTSPGSESSP